MRKGFTLIELLVVISIIGLLSSIVFASLNSARVKARDAKRKQDIRSIVTALAIYYENHNAYPANSYAGNCGTALDGTDLVSVGLKNDGLLSAMPSVPSHSGSCGDAYYSGTWNNAQNIAIFTRLEKPDSPCPEWNSNGDSWRISGSYCHSIYIQVLP